MFLFWLIIGFAALTLAVCKTKGLRALLSLVVSILALVKCIIPLIIAGYNPIISVILLSVPITVAIVYLTEGFTRLSHITTVTVLANFILTSGLTALAVFGTHLTGLITEDDAYIAGYGTHAINLPHLLVAGILLGTLGALIEMVVTQVATVEEVMEGNPSLTKKEIFLQAYHIGQAHLGSLINTLFLIYASVSLPLLIIIIGRDTPLLELFQSELIKTEIVRTIMATIGVIIAMPTSTALAVWWLRKK